MVWRLTQSLRSGNRQKRYVQQVDLNDEWESIQWTDDVGVQADFMA